MNSRDILEVLKKNKIEQGIDYFQFHAARFDFLIEKMEAAYAPGRTFLEIGSFQGYGMIAASLAGYAVSGTDLPRHVENARALSAACHFDNRPADLASDPLPFDDNSFDLIVCSEVLEHLNFHPGKFFSELGRVLKKGGRVILTTPNLSRLNNVLKMLAGKSINAELDKEFFEGTHYREYNADEVAYLLKEAGLAVKEISFVNFKYPGLGAAVKITDAVSALMPGRKRDLCVIGIKE